MKTLRLIATVAGLGLISVPAAQAATVGFDFGGHTLWRNNAMLVLDNTSSSASIKTVSLTIGDTSYNFDTVIRSGGVGMSRVQGDWRQGHGRFDEIVMAFTDFGAGKRLRFRTDIDKDSGFLRGLADYSSVFFNNGSAPNAVISVAFSTGDVLSATLADRAGLRGTRMGGHYRSLASGSQTVPDTDAQLSAVPLPATLPLLLGGLFGLGLFGRRRKS